MKCFLNTCLLVATVAAFRRTQFVRQGGPSYQAISLVNVYNETSARSDLHVRMQAAWYDSLARGWTAFAFGPQMKGALMFVMYGDPNTFPPQLVLSVRTTSGNHAPYVVDLAEHNLDVDIVRAVLEPSPKDSATNMAASHVGKADFVIRGYDTWSTALINPHSNKQSMVWASNAEQDFGDNVAENATLQGHDPRHLGFMWVDLQSALAKNSFFASIDDQISKSGISGEHFPSAPSEMELHNGEDMLASLTGAHHKAPPAPTSSAHAPSITPLQHHPQIPQQDLISTAQVVPEKTADNRWIKPWLLSRIHGALMALSYMVCLPIAMSVRARTSDLEESALSRYSKWQLGATFSATLSTAIALIQGSSGASVHSTLGMVIVWFQVVQVTLTTFLFSPIGPSSTTIHCCFDWLVSLLALSELLLGSLRFRTSGTGSITLRICTVLLALELVLLAGTRLMRRVQGRRVRRPAWFSRGGPRETREDSYEHSPFVVTNDDEDLTRDP